jgi:hypothetical protein
MSALDQWCEHLQERDAICAAILDLASVVKARSIACRLRPLDRDDEDQAVGAACARLAQLIEDPALASVITHALRRLWRRWEEEDHVVLATHSTPSVLPLLFHRLCKHLPHSASKARLKEARI